MNRRNTLRIALAVLSSMAMAVVLSGRGVETSGERDRRMAWWREARFGMFVHWGLYSGLAGTWDGKAAATSGGMEWIENMVRADTDTYAKRAIPLFKPKPGFAKEWARLAKDAGARYIVVTSKHHEGFALHDSAVSEYDAGSVLHRDLIREIVDAARAEGLKIGFYHSVIDWHHDQYQVRAVEAAAAPAPRTPLSQRHARSPQVPGLPVWRSKGARLELRANRHPLVGFQCAGFPG